MIDPKSQNSSLLSSALRFHMNKVDVFLLQGYFLFLMFNNGDLVVVLHFVIHVLQFPPQKNLTSCSVPNLSSHSPYSRPLFRRTNHICNWHEKWVKHASVRVNVVN